ncbi:MAG: cupin domain-containing protein [Alphaproteobacteria bacterium]|nr:cupin domain-containing protein [Alphaproteobacteria bacterium]
MIEAVNIKAALASRQVLRNRVPDTPSDDVDAAFATLATYREGGVFAGSFEGYSAWERHNKGDELVQVLSGKTTLTVLTDDGPEVLEMTGGMVTVVPQGCWHRFDAPDGVTVLTMTPQPTDHSTAEDPRPKV